MGEEADNYLRGGEINLLEKLEQKISGLPLIGPYYLKNAARIKRNTCLWLNSFNLLKPLTFIQWLVTYRCQFHCPYCEASAGERTGNELTTEEALNFIIDLSRMRLKRLLLSGGEPLMRPDILKLMTVASSKGIHMGLVTNGFLVSSLWERLRQYPLFLYFTSIDGLPAYNDRVRGMKEAFQQALRGLELMAQANVPVRMVNTVVHAQNIDQLMPLSELIRTSRATHWRLTPVARVGRAAETDRFELNKAQLVQIIQFIQRQQTGLNIDLGESHTYIGCFENGFVGKPFFCGAGLTRAAVMPDGEVLGCQQIYDARYSEGNIRETPFSHIWKYGFKDFRRDHYPESCRACLYLSACQGGCWAHMQLHEQCLKSLWKE